MNRADLIQHVTSKTGLPRQDVDAILTATFDTIVRSVAHGENGIVTGLGTFERVQRAARTGRNPRAGETIAIPARRAVKFHAATAWNEYANDPATLPETPVGRRGAAT